MLSHKSKYALKALIALSEEYGKGPLLISDIARRQGIPRRFLEIILLELKMQGFLRSKKGKGGGYELSRPPAQISVGKVMRTLEGPIAPLACVSKTAYERCEDCPDEAACGVRILMKQVRDAIAAILDSTTFEDVIRNAHVVRGGPAALLYSI
jgi:Rrf2 family protein